MDPAHLFVLRALSVLLIYHTKLRWPFPALHMFPLGIVKLLPLGSFPDLLNMATSVLSFFGYTSSSLWHRLLSNCGCRLSCPAAYVILVP